MIPSLPPGWESYGDLWDETGLDAIVFGSAALVDAWCRLGLTLQEKTIPVAWGSACARAAERLLGRDVLVMKEPTLEGLVNALIEIRKRKTLEEEK